MIDRLSRLLTLTVIAIAASEGHSQSLVTPRYTPPVVVAPTIVPAQRLPQYPLQLQSTLPTLRTPELVFPRQGTGSVSPTVEERPSSGNRPASSGRPRVEEYSPDSCPTVLGGSPPPSPRESDDKGETKRDTVFKLLYWLLTLGLALLVLRMGSQSRN